MKQILVLIFGLLLGEFDFDGVEDAFCGGSWFNRSTSNSDRSVSFVRWKN